MTNCKHNWKNENLYGSKFVCSKCGRKGNEVKRYDSKTGTDKWVVRAIKK